MRGIEQIRKADPALANEIVIRGGFLLDTHIPRLIQIDRLMLVLVRCGNGRFLTPVQDFKHFTTIIEEHARCHDEGLSRADYIRDVSLPAG